MARDREDQRREGEDPALERLLRDVSNQQQDASADFVRPDGEAVTAYLMGYATREQRESVQRGLLHSAAFRSEVSALIRELAKLDEPDAQTRFDDSAVPASRQHALGLGHPGLAETREEYRERESRAGLFDLLASLVAPRRLAIAAPIFAAIVIGILLATSERQERLPVHVAQEHRLTLEASHFTVTETMTLRGENAVDEAAIVDSEAVHEDHEAAARRVMRRGIEWTGSEFVLKELPVPISDEGPSSRLVLCLVDSTDTIVRCLQQSVKNRSVAESSATQSSDVQAWLAFLPDTEDARQIELRFYAMYSDSVFVRWKPDMGTRGCFSFSLSVADGFVATPATSFQLD